MGETQHNTTFRKQKHKLSVCLLLLYMSGKISSLSFVMHLILYCNFSYIFV